MSITILKIQDPRLLLHVEMERVMKKEVNMAEDEKA